MIWSYATRVYKLGPGDPFIIRVVPGCEFLDLLDNLFDKRGLKPEVLDQMERGLEVLNTIEARQDRPEEDRGNATHRSGSGNTWYQDPRIGARPEYGWLFDSIPGAITGNYTMNITLSAPMENLAIVDGNGDEYLR